MKSERERRENQKIKHKAKRALRRSIEQGKILKPKHCEYCGKEKKLEAHHWSYLPENWLDVIWLCVKCHRIYQDYSDEIMARKRKPQAPVILLKFEQEAIKRLFKKGTPINKEELLKITKAIERRIERKGKRDEVGRSPSEF